MSKYAVAVAPEGDSITLEIIEAVDPRHALFGHSIKIFDALDEDEDVDISDVLPDEWEDIENETAARGYLVAVQVIP